MSVIQQFIQRIRQAHYLSLDVVGGAVISHRVASRLPEGQSASSWVTVAALAICVFIIYVIDRLLDLRAVTPPDTARHRFHAQTRQSLGLAVLILGAIGLLLLFWLPGPVLRFGLGLGLVCALYVWGVSRLPGNHPALAWKEIAVAFLFTAGIWGSAWITKATVTWPEVGLGVMFLLTAFQNTIIFSLMEVQERPEAEAVTLATVLGPERCDWILRTLTSLVTLAGLAVCLWAPERFTQRASVMGVVMSAVLYLIQRYPAWFQRKGRYRWVGDGVFWLPGLVL